MTTAHPKQRLIQKEAVMTLPHDTNLIAVFKTLLESAPPAGKQKEQVIQDFLEEHTELIPTPNLLNHHLHMNSIVTKFRLSTAITTDYLYITKSSDSWRITLVELESSDKDIFTKNTKTSTHTAEFNAAVSQVVNWKIFLDKNKQEAIRPLKPLLTPTPLDRIEFHYQLIIGRSANKNLSDNRKELFQYAAKTNNIDILTYDSLMSYYENFGPYKKNVLHSLKEHFGFKRLHVMPKGIFAYLGPGQFFLSSDDEAMLKDAGYEIDKWKKGDPLIFNDKHARSTCDEHCKNGTLLSSPYKKTET